jgi:hypothetical protein
LEKGGGFVRDWMLMHRQDIHVRWTTTYETKSPDMEEGSEKA